MQKNYSLKSKFFHCRFNYQVIYPETTESSMVLNGWSRRAVRDEQTIQQYLERSENLLHASYQLETGETGIKHWQMTLTFAKPWNKYQVKRLFDVQVSETYYIEPCVNLQASATYCQKSATRLAGPFHYSRATVLDALNALGKSMK